MMEYTVKENNFVLSYLSAQPFLEKLYYKLSDAEKKAVEEIILINQASRLFSPVETEEDVNRFKNLLSQLVEIDSFYEDMGGIAGYHRKFISLLKGEKKKVCPDFIEPHQVDLSKLTPKVLEYIDIGLMSLPQIAEIYPLGGAGDRLDLVDEHTKEPLPQATYNFMGKSLIEHLIEDLKAREYLYYRTYAEIIVTPVVIMTSDVKKNHQHVMEIFKKNNYFGRPVDSFFFIKQISVPMINEEGNWVMKDKLQLDLRPGGHGVLWSLMSYHKVFDWLYTKQRTKAIVRQINNPVASVDYNILAFSGYGIKENKLFGFASCLRKAGAAEGMDVLKKEESEKGIGYNYSNIEYTDFQDCGIVDKPLEEGSEYSKFPSNTNILFADLKSVEKAASKDRFPGITINLKNLYLENGRKLRTGRIELLMQAIADNFVDYFEKEISPDKYLSLSTFVTQNIRRKTITVIKNHYVEGGPIVDTPLEAYFDVLQNYFDVLLNYCRVSLPTIQTISHFISDGPSFVCYLNPMLGPLFSSISEKICGGKIDKGSELKLDIADLYLENLSLTGSLHICGVTHDFKRNSKCILKNVKVKNEGIDRKAKNTFHQDLIQRKGLLKIVLYENAIFEAEDIIFEGSHTIEVRKDHKVRAVLKQGKIAFEEEVNLNRM